MRSSVPVPCHKAITYALMKSFFLLSLCLLGALRIRAETPALLNEAVIKLIENDEHWAYTRTTQPYDKEGRPKGGLTIEHYDPSQPYGSQWTLIQYRGHPPTESDISSWKSAKKKMANERHERTLGDVLDVDHATMISETPTVATFDVPIVKDASKRFPADKLQVLMQVDKAREALLSFSVQQREKFRVGGLVGMAAVASVDTVDVEGRLQWVDDKFAPVLTYVKGNGSGHVFGFFRVGAGSELHYSDFKRVKPYADRFGVKIGDVKALDF